MEGKEFKSGFFIIIKNLILYLIGVGFLAFLIYCFYPSYIVFLVAAVLFVFIAYGVLIKDNIKIVVDDNYVVIYCKNKKKFKFDRKECIFGYRVTTTNGDSSDMLYVTLPDGKDEIIDCSNLGYVKFMEFVHLLKAHDEPVKIEVLKKEK